jgi:hypothetical protein
MPTVIGAGMKLAGVAGDTGPSGIPFIAYPGDQVPSFGQLGSVNARTLTANISQLDLAGGTSLPVYFKPLQSGALYQAVFYNATSSSNTVTLTLRNYADDSVVWSSGPVAKGSTYVSPVYSPTQVALAAGQVYYWGVQGGATGTYTCWLTPQLYGPSGGAGSTSSHPTFVLAPSTALLGTTQLSGTGRYMGPVGFTTGNQLTFQLPYGGYVSNVAFANGGTGTANFFLQNTTANSLAWTGPSVASGQTFSTGSLGPSAIPLTANTKYAWYVTGSGSMGQNVSMQICQ